MKSKLKFNEKALFLTPVLVLAGPVFILAGTTWTKMRQDKVEIAMHHLAGLSVIECATGPCATTALKARRPFLYRRQSVISPKVSMAYILTPQGHFYELRGRRGSWLSKGTIDQGWSMKTFRLNTKGQVLGVRQELSASEIAQLSQ